ncbi:CBS domain-containing protein [Nitrososphaera sp.]|uniref:CBS domain-containing protein n=1 Tax=Nitrososphaera sp. TaxID=1971748 RepID=UPI0031701CF8
MQDISIKAAAPQIFRRPLLYVSPADSLFHAATFLAVGPQIYADGLVVLDAGRLVGRIGGKHLAKHILWKKERWLDASAGEIGEPLEKPLDADSPLKDALSMFSETRFAFMPVATGGKIVASLSIRDLLGIADKTRKAVQLASPITAVQENMGVVEALRFMVDKAVRNLVTMRPDGPYFINDRRVLEFLLSHEARQLVQERGFSALDDVPLSHIEFYKGRVMNPDESTSTAASLLSDVCTPCIFIGYKILTPWDLVMK